MVPHRVPIYACSQIVAFDARKRQHSSDGLCADLHPFFGAEAIPMNWNAAEFWIDGGCLGNNDAHGKRNAYGSISDGKAIMRRRFPKARTNNEAEYMTLLASLKNILMYRTDPNGPMIYNDSKLMVGQLTQGSKVKAENLLQLHEEAALLLVKTKAKLVWLPRLKIVEKLGHRLRWYYSPSYSQEFRCHLCSYSADPCLQNS